MGDRFGSDNLELQVLRVLRLIRPEVARPWVRSRDQAQHGLLAREAARAELGQAGDGGRWMREALQKRGASS